MGTAELEREVVSAFSTQNAEDVCKALNGNKTTAAQWAFCILKDEYARQKQCADIDARNLKGEVAGHLRRQVEALVPMLDLSVINALSGEPYESSHCAGFALSFIPFYLKKDDLPTLRLEDALLYEKKDQLSLSLENVHAIRKRLNLTKDGSLAVCPIDGQLYITGILPLPASTWFIQIYFTGHMEWLLCVPSHTSKEKGNFSNASDFNDRCRIRFGQGRLLLPIIDLSFQEADRIKSRLKGKGPSSDMLYTLLGALKANGIRGALLIFGDETFIKNEVKRLCTQNNQGIKLHASISLAERTDMLRKLTSVDGALLVDNTGKCHAYGVILDGKAKKGGDTGRGSRFNSAVNYTSSHKGSFAIVLSEDGMIDILIEGE